MIQANCSFDVVDGFVVDDCVVVVVAAAVSAPALHIGAYDVVESQDFDIN